MRTILAFFTCIVLTSYCIIPQPILRGFSVSETMHAASSSQLFWTGTLTSINTELESNQQIKPKPTLTKNELERMKLIDQFMKQKQRKKEATTIATKESAHNSANTYYVYWNGKLTTVAAQPQQKKMKKMGTIPAITPQELERARIIDEYFKRKKKKKDAGVKKGQKKKTTFAPTVHAALIPYEQRQNAENAQYDHHLVAPTRNTSTTTLLPVFNQKDIDEKHKMIADQAYRQIPKKCQNVLKEFYVRYDNPKSRGLAGSKSMILDGGVPDDEFRSLFMHEIAHVLDLSPEKSCLHGTPDSGISEFKDGKRPMYNNDPSLAFYRISWANSKTRKAGSKDEDFVSGYATWDVFEDFAESHTFFVLHNEEFRAIAQTNSVLAAKYNFFLQYLYPNGVNMASSLHINGTKRPWDITKLPYNWHIDDHEGHHQH